MIRAFTDLVVRHDVRVFVLGVLFFSFVTAAQAVGGEKQATLTFALPQGEVFHYKSSLTAEQNFMGMDISTTQSAEVDLTLIETLEDGNSQVSLAFSNLKASRMRDEELDATEPPLDLDGKTVRAIVTPKGDIEKVEAGGYIPGLRNVEQLEDIIGYWFVYLPDTLVNVGESWVHELLEPAKEEGDPPTFKGSIEYVLKKVEEKKGKQVAVIEGKGTGEIYQSTGMGELNATVKITIKAKVAVDGGYTVESKHEYETKGKLVRQDYPTGEGKETDVADTRYFECKLKD